MKTIHELKTSFHKTKNKENGLSLKKKKKKKKPHVHWKSGLKKELVADNTGLMLPTHWLQCISIIYNELKHYACSFGFPIFRSLSSNEGKWMRAISGCTSTDSASARFAKFRYRVESYTLESLKAFAFNQGKCISFTVPALCYVERVWEREWIKRRDNVIMQNEDVWETEARLKKHWEWRLLHVNISHGKESNNLDINGVECKNKLKVH